MTSCNIFSIQMINIPQLILYALQAVYNILFCTNIRADRDNFGFFLEAKNTGDEGISSKCSRRWYLTALTLSFRFARIFQRMQYLIRALLCFSFSAKGSARLLAVAITLLWCAAFISDVPFCLFYSCSLSFLLSLFIAL